MRFFLFSLLFTALDVFAQNNDLNNLISEHASKHRFQGVVLAQKNGKTVYHKAFGKANIPFDVSNGLSTKFQVASITKLFTAVLILKLVEENKVELGATISRYLPDYKGEAAQKVTVHQLLNHTSGMANMEDYPDPEFKYDWLEIYGKPYTTDQILTKFCQGRMKHEPGKVFEYNNGEYVILGKIIEKVSGKTFKDVLQEYILQPLSLKNSGMCFQANIISGLADTYSYNKTTKILEKDESDFIQNWYAAGAMYSTSTDLLTFINKLFQFKIIKKQSLLKILEPGLENYGYGVWIRGKDNKVMERYGRIRGTNTVILRYLDSDLTIIILGNTDAINNLGPFGYLIASHLSK